jgi:hypothetical protein
MRPGEECINWRSRFFLFRLLTLALLPMGAHSTSGIPTPGLGAAGGDVFLPGFARLSIATAEWAKRDQDCRISGSAKNTRCLGDFAMSRSIRMLRRTTYIQLCSAFLTTNDQRPATSVGREPDRQKPRRMLKTAISPSADPHPPSPRKACTFGKGCRRHWRG